MDPRLVVITTQAWPPELLERCFEFLHDDTLALKAAALICRAWTPSSQRWLFHEVVISGGQSSTKNVQKHRYSTIRQRLLDLPHLRPHVRTLRCDGSPVVDDPTIVHELSMLFPAVSTLVIVRFFNTAFVAAFPSLRTLVLKDVLPIPLRVAEESVANNNAFNLHSNSDSKSGSKTEVKIQSLIIDSDEERLLGILSWLDSTATTAAQSMRALSVRFGKAPHLSTINQMAISRSLQTHQSARSLHVNYDVEWHKWDRELELVQHRCALRIGAFSITSLRISVIAQAPAIPLIFGLLHTSELPALETLSLTLSKPSSRMPLSGTISGRPSDPSVFEPFSFKQELGVGRAAWTIPEQLAAQLKRVHLHFEGIVQIRDSRDLFALFGVARRSGVLKVTGDPRPRFA